MLCKNGKNEIVFCLLSSLYFLSSRRGQDMLRAVVLFESTLLISDRDAASPPNRVTKARTTSRRAQPTRTTLPAALCRRRPACVHHWKDRHKAAIMRPRTVGGDGRVESTTRTRSLRKNTTTSRSGRTSGAANAASGLRAPWPENGKSSSRRG